MTTKQQLVWLFTVLAVVGVSVSAYLWWAYPRLTERSRTFKFVRSTDGANDSTQNLLPSSPLLAVELVDYED